MRKGEGSSYAVNTTGETQCAAQRGGHKGVGIEGEGGAQRVKGGRGQKEDCVEVHGIRIYGSQQEPAGLLCGGQHHKDFVKPGLPAFPRPGSKQANSSPFDSLHTFNTLYLSCMSSPF